MTEVSEKSARTKIVAMGLILGVIFACSSGYLAYQFMGKTKDQRLLYLKQAVQIARNSIEPILVEYRDQHLSMEDTLEQIRNRVRCMTYEDHTGKNYIFMSAYDGIMLVQPFEPEKEMTDAWDLKDAHGVYIIRALVNTAKSRTGQGYVSYHYQRPGETSAQEKVSFVMGIPELGCYIGTGQYMADIRHDQFIYNMKIAGLTSVLLILLFSLVWASMKEIRTKNMMLEKAERELQAIFDNTFQFVGSLYPDGTLNKVNRTALKFIGSRKSDVVGKPFWETAWWQGEKIKRRLRKAIRDCNRGEFCRFEASHKNEAGVVHVDFSLSPIFDTEGRVMWLLAEGRDISEQVRVRNDLIKEQAFFNYVIDSLPGLFFLYKRCGGQYLMEKWNITQHEKILGYSREDIKDRPITWFVNPDDLPVVNNALDNLLEAGTVNVQIDTRTKEHRVVPVLYSAKHFKHEGDHYIVGTGIELTEKIRAEQEKKRLEGLLAQSQKMEAIGTLAGGIAHDFNNILSAILGYAELVQKKLPPDERIGRMQTRVIDAAIRAKNLVNQILLFSRQSELEMKPVQVDRVIKEALKLIRSSIPTTIEIQSHIPDNSGLILADATQIHQIIMNLCTNAYHSMRASGGRLRVALTRQTIMEKASPQSKLSLAPGAYLKLEVSDTGHGMDGTTLDKIFDPYFTTKEKGEGTGLGLSVVHGIVNNCGGDIEVVSAPGQGTRVSVYFPRLRDEIQNGAQQGAKALQTGSERVILVDDDLMVLEMMRHCLEDLGYRVTGFSSSRKALDAFRETPDRWDLLITDMTMPKMTGIELSTHLLGIRPRLPVILCTGYSELITREKARDMGIKGFLLKPVLREVLANTIREVLEG